MHLKIAKQLASRYLQDHDFDPTQELAKIAEQEKLSAHQIERVVNRANREIIVGLQKEAVAGNHDPHFTFPTIKTAKVIAILRQPGPGVQPGLPRPDVTRPDPVVVRHRIEDFAQSPDAIQDKALGLQVLQLLKDKMRAKKSKVSAIEIALEGLIRKLEKTAANELLSGTPVEAIEALPVTPKGLTEKLASWGHTLKHTDEEIELDPEHEVVKLAFEIEAKFNELDEAQRLAGEDQHRLDAVNARIKEL